MSLKQYIDIINQYCKFGDATEQTIFKNLEQLIETIFMILFDNIYYLLYNYFQRTNSGRYGFKLTSTALTGIYVYIGIGIIYCLAIILYSLFQSDEIISVNIAHQNPLLFVNGDIFKIGCVLCVICIDVRYYVIKNTNEIHKKINDMDMEKREQLNKLTVSYMVVSPILLFFIADYIRDLYK